jgi:hypothetical protein
MLGLFLLPKNPYTCGMKNILQQLDKLTAQGRILLLGAGGISWLLFTSLVLFLIPDGLASSIVGAAMWGSFMAFFVWLATWPGLNRPAERGIAPRDRWALLPTFWKIVVWFTGGLLVIGAGWLQNTLAGVDVSNPDSMTPGGWLIVCVYGAVIAAAGGWLFLKK